VIFIHPDWRCSATRVQAAEACLRKWYLDEVLRLPRPEAVHFALGTAYHLLCERHLRGENPFQPGWNDNLTVGVQRDIKDLLHAAIANGLLPEEPYTHHHEVEWEIEPMAFENPALPPLQGVLDLAHLDPDAGKVGVEDHKTTSSWKYAKTPETLRKDRQGLTYARAVLIYLRGKGYEPETISMRHNTVLKTMMYNKADRDKGRARIIEVEGGYTVEEIERNWREVEEIVGLMVEYSQETDWSAVPGNFSHCSAFGGCRHTGLCGQTESLTQHFEHLAENQ